MMKIFRQLPIAGKLMVAAGITIAVLLLVGFSAVIFQTSGVVETLSDEAELAQAAAQAGQVKADVALYEATARSLASSLGSLHERGNRDRNTAVDLLKTDILSTKMALGAWTMIEPDAWDGRDAEMKDHPGSNRHGNLAPYWVKDGGKLTQAPNDEPGAYNEPYYRMAFDNQKGAITEPYEYELSGGKVTMTSLVFPVKSNGRTIGVAGVDIALDSISERLASHRPFGTGHVMLLSSSGTWVAHHDAARRMKPYADAGVEEMREAMASGEARTLHAIEVDGEIVQRVIRPFRIEGLNATWAVVIDVPETTISAHSTQIAWQLVLGGLVILGGVLACLFLASRSIIGRPMAELSTAVDRLAKGETLAVPQTDRADEIGTMARAADVFRQAAADRAAADARVAAEQKVVTESLARSLNAMTAGDLTADITAEFPTGYAELKTNFNEALAALRALIGSVTESAAAIRTGSGEIAQASEDLARRTEGNAASLEETSAALVQIDGRLKASATAAGRTVERADQAIAIVGEGRATADEAVQAMGRVNESAKGIDSVIEGLDKIAFQTRVLAMNAAVEAGRAGDAGRGFAVVADLVSALAMRSEEEAKRARDQLTATQGDIVAAVEAVQRVDGALANISGSVADVHQLLNTMAADNQAQSAAISQISTAIGSMDQATQQNAAMVEETSAAARNLTSEVGELSAQAAKFTVAEAAPLARQAAPKAPVKPAPAKAAPIAVKPYVSPVKPLPALANGQANGHADWQDF